ncbi:hypothetical protein [Bosea sp. TAF32]|uniref:hypothetical protein n=1 Tax=Bosea sp. TAF32 TaxID=3237482 RepID=UPI003F8DB10B
MTPVSTISALARRIPVGVRLAGLALVAGLSYGAAATPASAAMTDWQMACQDKAAPQGYGESIRYNNCVRQRDCERLANQMGHMTMAMGCFGVMPDASAAPARSRY